MLWILLSRWPQAELPWQVFCLEWRDMASHWALDLWPVVEVIVSFCFIVQSFNSWQHGKNCLRERRSKFHVDEYYLADSWGWSRSLFHQNIYEVPHLLTTTIKTTKRCPHIPDLEVVFHVTNLNVKFSLSNREWEFEGVWNILEYPFVFYLLLGKACPSASVFRGQCFICFLKRPIYLNFKLSLHFVWCGIKKSHCLLKEVQRFLM